MTSKDAKMFDTKNVVKLITIDTLHVTSNAAGMDPIHCIKLVLGFLSLYLFASYEGSCFPFEGQQKESN
jgi:hypothetical protein